MTEFKVHINCLPVELITQIFSRVGQCRSSLLMCRLSCRHWRNICDAYFFKLNAVLTDDTLKYLENRRQSDSHPGWPLIPLETLRVHNLKATSATLATSSVSRGRLACEPQALIFQENSACSICPSINERNLRLILLQNRNVSSLTFERGALRGITLCPGFKNLSLGIPLQNLHQLVLYLEIGSSVDRDDVELLNSLSKLRTPNLGTLRLSVSIFDSSRGLAATQAYFAMYNFLVTRRSPHLKVLEMENITDKYKICPLPGHGDGGNGDMEPESRMSIPSRNDFNYYLAHVNGNALLATASDDDRILLSPEKMEGLRRELGEIQLDTLKVEFSPREGSAQHTLGFHLLSNQRRLSHLEVNCRSGMSELSFEVHTDTSYFVQLAEAIQRNEETLRVFIIQYGRVLLDQDFPILSKALTRCAKLEELKLVIFTNPTFPHPLPPSLKKIHLIGSLNPNLLVCIKDGLPLLENLTFLNVDSEFIPRNEEFVTVLKSLLVMPCVKKVAFCSPAMDFEFVREMTVSPYVGSGTTGSPRPIKVDIVRVPNNTVAYIDVPH